MASIGFTPNGPVVAEDVRDLQNWTCHQRRASSGRLVLLADEMIEFLQTLVRIPTINPPGKNYAECAGVIGVAVAARKMARIATEIGTCQITSAFSRA